MNNNPEDPPCHKCPARCCHQHNSGWPFASELRPEEEAKFAEIAVYNPTVQAMVLPYNEHGICHFLQEDNRCGIYEDRPQTCREFSCTTGTIIFLSRNPELLTLLEEDEKMAKL